MKIFNFKKKNKEQEVRTMSDVYVDLFAECDKLMDVSLKATGSSFEDLLADLDEESGRIIGSTMETLRKTMDLCAEQAAIIDRMERKLDQVNEHLLSQDRKLQMLIGAAHIK